MTQFTRGDKIQLKRPFAKAIMKDRKTPNWLDRRGVVDACNSYAVYVLWDGRTRCEQLPIKAVEMAT